MNCLSNWVALWNWVEHFSRFSVRHHRWTAPLPPVESNVVVHFLIFALLALWPVVNRGNSVVFSVRHSIDSWNFAMNLENWYTHDISDLTSDLLVKSEMHKKTALIYDNHLYFQWIWSIIKISAIAQIYERKKHTLQTSQLMSSFTSLNGTVWAIGWIHLCPCFFFLLQSLRKCWISQMGSIACEKYKHVLNRNFMQC